MGASFAVAGGLTLARLACGGGLDLLDSAAGCLFSDGDGAGGLTGPRVDDDGSVDWAGLFAGHGAAAGRNEGGVKEGGIVLKLLLLIFTLKPLTPPPPPVSYSWFAVG